MTTPTAAGWYDDPDVPEQLRYFDGIVWTAHTTPRRSASAASSSIGRSLDVPQGTDRGAWQHQASGPRAPSGQPSAPPDWSATPGGSWQQAQRREVHHDGAVLAEWWRRLLGRAIDWFVVSLVSAMVSLPFLGDLIDAFDTYFSVALNGGTPDQAAFTTALEQATVPITVIGLVVGLLYETSFLVWRSATPGKLLLGTLVRPVAGAGKISLVVALRRQAISVVTSLLGLNALLGLFGFFLSVADPAWLLWDAKRQALHDKVAETIVVRRS